MRLEGSTVELQLYDSLVEEDQTTGMCSKSTHFRQTNFEVIYEK